MPQQRVNSGQGPHSGSERSPEAAATTAASDPRTGSSGSIFSPSGIDVPERSAIKAVVRNTAEPSLSGNRVFALATPTVDSPKERTSRRPSSDRATASPELPVRLPRTTASGTSIDVTVGSEHRRVGVTHPVSLDKPGRHVILVSHEESDRISGVQRRERCETGPHVPARMIRHVNDHTANVGFEPSKRSMSLLDIRVGALESGFLNSPTETTATPSAPTETSSGSGARVPREAAARSAGTQKLCLSTQTQTPPPAAAQCLRLPRPHPIPHPAGPRPSR